MSKKKKIISKKKPKVVETGFATLEDLIIGKTTKKAVRKIRKPKTKVIVKTPTIVEERPLNIKYYLEIISLITSEEGFIKEIVFTNKGVLVIPPSLKDIYKPDSHTTQSTFIIPENIKDPILTKHFNNLTRTETLNFLKDHLTDTYMTGIKKIIYKEVWPEHKIIDQLPWK